MLAEPAWKVTLTPGPLQAFFLRVRARRWPQIAATAVSRKLGMLSSPLLTREQDYAFGRPAMTATRSANSSCSLAHRPKKTDTGSPAANPRRCSRPNANSHAKPKPPITG
jgi:transposase